MTCSHRPYLSTEHDWPIYKAFTFDRARRGPIFTSQTTPAIVREVERACSQHPPAVELALDYRPPGTLLSGTRQRLCSKWCQPGIPGPAWEKALPHRAESSADKRTPPYTTRSLPNTWKVG